MREGGEVWNHSGREIQCLAESSGTAPGKNATFKARFWILKKLAQHFECPFWTLIISPSYSIEQECLNNSKIVVACWSLCCKAWSFIESLEIPSRLQVCVILSTQGFQGKHYTQIRFYKLPVGQVLSLYEAWSFKKLWGYQLWSLCCKVFSQFE